MNAMSRPLAILAAAAAGGAGLWIAGHWDMDGNGGYWAVLAVVAVIGLLLGLAQLRVPEANPTAMLLVAWIPITIVSGWVLVASQPESNTFRDHVNTWSSNMGIAGVVDHVGPFAAVLALAIGLVFGLTMLASWAAVEDRDVVVAEEEAPAAQPVVAAEPAVEPNGERTRVRPRERLLLVP